MTLFISSDVCSAEIERFIKREGERYAVAGDLRR